MFLPLRCYRSIVLTVGWCLCPSVKLVLCQNGWMDPARFWQWLPCAVLHHVFGNLGIHKIRALPRVTSFSHLSLSHHWQSFFVYSAMIVHLRIALVSLQRMWLVFCFCILVPPPHLPWNRAITDCVSIGGNAITSVRLYILLFPLLSFGLSDIGPLPFACIWSWP